MKSLAPKRPKQPASSDGLNLIHISIIAVVILILAAPTLARLQWVQFTITFAVIFSGGALLYWRSIYVSRGLDARPRMTFRMYFVVYIGMSIESGLLAYTATRPEQHWGLAGMLLPVALVYLVALIDDYPAQRTAIPTRRATFPRQRRLQ
jgi:hypothetical protein